MLCWPTLTHTSWTLTWSWAKRPRRSHEIFKQNTVAALQDSCLHVNWTVGGQRFRLAHPSNGHKARDMSRRNGRIQSFLPRAVNFAAQILVFSAAALQATPDELLNHAEFKEFFFSCNLSDGVSLFFVPLWSSEKDNGNLECLTAVTKMPVVCYWRLKNGFKELREKSEKEQTFKVELWLFVHSAGFNTCLLNRSNICSLITSHASICLRLIFI